MPENLPLPWDSLFGELEREKIAIEQALSAYRDFCEKLSHLPPSLAKRVAEVVGLPYKGPHEQVDSPVVPPSLAGQERARSLAGKTSEECAIQILEDRGNKAMHFAEIAKEALSRGYVGHQLEAEEEANSTTREYRAAQSFWAMMHRASDKFEKTGKGFFRLASSGEEDTRKTETASSESTGQASRPPHRSLAGHIVALLQERGEPMRGVDIVNALKEAGVQTKSRLGLGPMVFSTLRKRKKLFKNLERGIYTLNKPSNV